MLTEEKEDYLKAILYNHGIENYVTNKTLSHFLNIKPPSVTEMLNRLEKDGFVEIKPYKGVKLSEKGLASTLDIIKRHRLIELFLIKVLKYDWEEVHKEAEILEHRVSDLFVSRLDELLDYPETCPHGGVIPRENKFEEKYTTGILEKNENEKVLIKRVRDKTDLLVYLSSKGVAIGSEATIVRKDELNQLIELKVGQTEFTLSYDNAKFIFVES